MSKFITPLILLGTVSTSFAANNKCWIDKTTGYTCCPHPWGGVYCDSATGPDWFVIVQRAINIRLMARICSWMLACEWPLDRLLLPPCSDCRSSSSSLFEPTWVRLLDVLPWAMLDQRPMGCARSKAYYTIVEHDLFTDYRCIFLTVFNQI